MSRRALARVAFVIAVVAGTLLVLSGKSASTASPQSRLATDLYPLYPGAQWGEVQPATSPDFGTVELVESLPFDNITDIASVTAPYTQYYDQKLTQAGWTRDRSREAGGPGAELAVYTKGDQFIVVLFSSVFHIHSPDAPAQCPCDTTLTLMSGTQTGRTIAQVQASRAYADHAVGFSIALPTLLASSSNDLLFSVDPSYEYTEKGPGQSIPGVKFTIPKSLASGTNLAPDTYLSVEHLPKGAACDASAFLADPGATSHPLREGAVSYSVASSTGAGVGNRYEEWVYARTGTDPCIAVRYFIHYAAIENFPPGAVREFDHASLLQTFDAIRRTLRVAQ